MTELNEQAALEALIVNNRDLTELEDLIAEFNIFEALGIVRQELRHSDFLSFLLNPAERHGIGDYFLKSFLIRVLNDADSSPIEIDIIDLNDAVVERETQHIDILIYDDAE